MNQTNQEQIAITAYMKKIYSELAMYAVVIATCFIILVWAIRLLELDFTVPFGYGGGDSMQVIAVLKGVIDNGWYYENPHLGMPNGQHHYDFPVEDALTFLLIRVLSTLFSDYAIIINSLYLLGFFLTTITSFAVFRHFQISFMPALIGSLLYTFIPYHFIRGLGHFLLGIYFILPPAIMVVLWIFSRKDLLFGYNTLTAKSFFNLKSSNFWIAAFICLLVSGSGIYYAFFTCFFLFIAGISALLWRKSYNFFNALILIGVILFGTITQLAPNIAYQKIHGSNLVQRSPNNSEVYGLKITHLLLPAYYHRISTLAQFTNHYNSTAPLVNENRFATLGIIGSVGFLFLLSWIMFYRQFIISDIIEHLSVLNLSAVLLATIGGFASLFSYITHVQIRSYNRISIFIAFFALLTVGLLLEKWRTNWVTSPIRQTLFYVVTGCLLILGILDQWPIPGTPNANRTQYFQDQQFVHNIEAQLPKNTMIFQLPYIPYPEHPSVHNMHDYEHTKAYFHSTHLRWSYGAPKGREADIWQQRVAVLPSLIFLKRIHEAGFGGLWIDRFGYSDNGVNIIEQFNQLLKAPPIESVDKRYAFWNISNVTTQQFFDTDCFNIHKEIKLNNKDTACGYILTNGWYGLEHWGIWSSANAEMQIDLPKDCQNEIGCELKLSLGQTGVFRTTTAKPKKVFAKINDQSIGEWSITGAQTIVIPLDSKTLQGKLTNIKIQFNIPAAGSPKQFGMSKDRRILGMGLSAYQLIKRNTN